MRSLPARRPRGALHIRRRDDPCIAMGRRARRRSASDCGRIVVRHPHACRRLAVAGRARVLLVNTSANPRWGNARIAVDIARSLAADGVASLRMDAAGMGDSRRTPARRGRPIRSRSRRMCCTPPQNWRSERSGRSSCSAYVLAPITRCRRPVATTRDRRTDSGEPAALRLARGRSVRHRPPHRFAPHAVLSAQHAQRAGLVSAAARRFRCGQSAARVLPCARCAARDRRRSIRC